MLYLLTGKQKVSPIKNINDFLGYHTDKIWIQLEYTEWCASKKEITINIHADYAHDKTREPRRSLW